MPRKTRSKKEVLLSKAADTSKIRKKDEEPYAIVRIEQPVYDSRTGERMSYPREVTFNEGDWLQFIQHGITQFGYVVLEYITFPESWTKIDITELK